MLIHLIRLLLLLLILPFPALLPSIPPLLASLRDNEPPLQIPYPITQIPNLLIHTPIPTSLLTQLSSSDKKRFASSRPNRDYTNIAKLPFVVLELTTI